MLITIVFGLATGIVVAFICVAFLMDKCAELKCDLSAIGNKLKRFEDAFISSTEIFTIMDKRTEAEMKSMSDLLFALDKKIEDLHNAVDVVGALVDKSKKETKPKRKT